MKDLLLGQKPAFASVCDRYKQEGISTRLYLAAMAMQGLLANRTMLDSHGEDSIEWCSIHAFLQADSLLKQEQNEKNN